MDKTLVIVESPGKIKKIQSYLGDDYIVKASFGHCRDLDSSVLSIDIDNNFKPYYKIIPGKRKVVNELKDLTSHCKDVILAADEDREGEMIASSLADLLKLKKPKRIVFHEITKKAIDKAIKNITTINYNMVDAQQARRLLDRIVGYKVSPILWKNINGAKSAGRVQSVVVKIIIDKEKEIEESVSSPYFKSTGNFSYKKNNIKSVLKDKSSIYKFDSEEEVKRYLSSINKKTIFKVIDVSKKKIEKKPPVPFITSSLQQEASTRLGFAVKRTMDAAQKLYEGGHITYMRTDSINISKDAIEAAKNVIIELYGNDYSSPRAYSKNKKGAQEAHECVRPTKLDHRNITMNNSDCVKLYDLIWKRTIASQMSNAIINQQTIKIDVFNDDESILPDGVYYVQVLEDIKFDGYLKLYYNNENDIEDLLKLKKDKEVKLDCLDIIEEYTKPPYRYNEAGLVKYLEKNGIGRPSTFASIISKIIEREYVKIDNIEGFKKESRTFKLNSKFKLLEKVKEIIIGKENKKIIPTYMGKNVNEFLEKNFNDLLRLKFTSEMEDSLDKIADGKIKYYNVLQTFYDGFNPIVEKLNKEIKDISNGDKLLGIINDKNIYVGKGKYGPYIKYNDDTTNKMKYVGVSSLDITLEEAEEYLKYPKLLGDGIYIHKGKNGLYLKKGKDIRSFKDTNMKLEEIKKLFDVKKDKNLINEIKIKGLKYLIKNGPYGPYIQRVGKRIKNIKIPKDIDPESIDQKQLLLIINDMKKN